MSYAIPSYYDEPAQVEQIAVPDLIFVPRSRFHWVALLLPLMLTGVSYLGGGVPDLTDLGFVAFTLICGYFLALEFFRFPRRFGIGGLVLYGGVLCWFCQDYFTHWYHRDFNDASLDGFGITPYIIAKVAFLHVLFVTLMSIGLNIKAGKWAPKVLLLIPDPGSRRFYLVVMLTMFGFGLTPYLFFCNENFFLGVWHAATACWTQAPALTAFRDGNLNYRWDAYVGQIMQVGAVSGLVAVLYCILIARNWVERLIGLAIWSFYALTAFQTGRRGEISFSLLPAIALLFIRYQVRLAMAFRKFSIWPYVVCGVLALGMQLVVQIQGSFRDQGLALAEISKVELFKNQGNTMFSEGLLGYSLVPEQHDFFYADDFPGEGYLRALPQTAIDLVIGIIPRALWNNKPVDKLWSWYNLAYTGVGNGVSGTTISHGLVGSWYFKYGMGGVIEGGLLVGWLMGVSERALQNSDGRPLSILMSLGFAVWLFRIYRDFIFIELYGLVLGGVALYILVVVMGPLLRDSSANNTATG
jgi:hypothetical protein